MATNRSARVIAVAAGLATAVAVSSPNTTSDIYHLFHDVKESTVNTWNSAVNLDGLKNENATFLYTENKLYAEFQGTVFEFQPVMSVDNDGVYSLLYTASKRNKIGQIKGDMADRAKDLFSSMYSNGFFEKEKSRELGVPHEVNLPAKGSIIIRPGKTYLVPVPVSQYQSIADIVQARR